MSIFPRKLTKGENCIIHLRFTNSSMKLKKLHYSLKILNPNGDEIKNIADDFILGNSMEEFKKEFYYCFDTNSNTMLGKYRVIPSFYYNGVELKSQTANFDYFVVEEIKVDVVNDKEYYLTNLSNENTLVEFIKIKNGKNEYSKYDIKGTEKVKFNFDADKIFIKYGNNFIEEIMKKNDKIYERKPELFWKKIDDKVLIYDDISNKKIILEKDESIIWNMLDGIHTNEDISKETNLSIHEIEVLESKWKERQLI